MVVKDLNSLDQLRKHVESLLTVPVMKTTLVEGGRNNLVVAMGTQTGQFVAKAYFHDVNDSRDRLESEYGMLSFLWSHGVRNISEPVALDRRNRIGVYKFVDGQTPRPEDLTSEDILSLVGLLSRMWELRTDLAARQLPFASASCFSFSDYLDMIGQRVEKLLSVLDSHDELCRQAKDFLVQEFIPYFRHHCALLEGRPDFRRKLAYPDRTLSPSDHGFHNAIRNDGGCIFIDFEYAGWDDPAKMMADAVHHPAVPFPERFRILFVENMIARCGPSSWLADRFRVIHPVIGLNWCLIMLNEFIPVSLRRRRFSGLHTNCTDHRDTQLKKAQKKFAEVLSDHRLSCERS